MRTGRKYPILLALAVSLATYAGLTTTAARAQSRPSRASAGIYLSPDKRSALDVQATEKALQQPVSPDELQRFATDFTTLLRALHDLNALHPEVQSSLIEAQHKLATLTPEQWTVLANAYDRPTLSNAVERLRSGMPSLNTAGAG
jgi:hypothetical protein